jgi:Flp pilus assembly protein TadD
MALEFSGPRAINLGRASSNAAVLKRLLDGAGRPPTIAGAVASAKAADWRDRGAMMMGVQAYPTAFEDYAVSVKLDPMDVDALSGLVKAAVGANRHDDALRLLESLADSREEAVGLRVAMSKLLATSGRFEEAVAAAENACRIGPGDPAAFEQLASLYADAGDAARLDPIVDVMERRFPERASTRYYAAASNFLRGRFPTALGLARQAIEADPQRASAYNLLGAIHASLGQVEDARPAFQQALRLDRRDSATYTNLGVLELSLGNRSTAADLFAEALSLDPGSASARQGLAQSAESLVTR